MAKSNTNESEQTQRPSQPSPMRDSSQEGSHRERSRSHRNRARKTSPDDLSENPTLGKNLQDSRPAPTRGSDTEEQVTDRYVRVGEVGRGGWGIVEKVVDRQLDREVAVKRLTGSENLTQQERLRFLHEAKITSQLQHPGIVPVHEMREQGDAFYVMKLLDGITFQESIQRHHRDQVTSSRQTCHQFGESLRPLLQRFIDVCNAVAYAHQHNVIHRDLKPSNVMVSDFGETIVLDWGLAHVAGADPQPITSSDQPSGKAIRANVSTLIEPDGTVIGTPAYMSPEQATGNNSAIGTASDIYSLGMILFTIVAGRHPYHGDAIDSILERVKRADHPDLRCVQPLVPKPLLAIVRKATQRHPNNRYASAEQLAEDVRRFIAGESVSVHREGMIEQAVRWSRHHQGIAATGAISLTLLLLASIGFGVVIYRSHQAEQAARLRAQAAYHQAVENLVEAREAADTWLIELSGSLEFHPGMGHLRSELLGRAIDQYQEITKRTSSVSRDVSPDTRDRDRKSIPASLRETETLVILEQVKSHLRLGDLFRLQDRLTESQNHYEQAESLLAAVAPGNLSVSRVSRSNLDASPDRRLPLEGANALIGRLLLADSSKPASPLHRQAPEHRRVVAARRWLWSVVEAKLNESKDITSANPPTDPLDRFTARAASALVRLELAIHSAEKGIIKEVDEQAYHRAIVVARWLANRNDTVAHRRLSENIQTLQCDLLMRNLQTREAVAAWSQLIEDLTQWLAKSPARIDYRQSIAHAMLRRGNGLVSLGNRDAAKLDYEHSIRLLKEAWRLTDDDGFYQLNLAAAENNLGRVLASGTDANPAVALNLLRQSLSTYEALLRNQVNGENLARFAITHHSIAAFGMDSSRVAIEEHSSILKQSARAKHARAAIQAFEILGDYQSLSLDEELSWLECELIVLSGADDTTGEQTRSRLVALTQRQQTLSLNEDLSQRQTAWLARLRDRTAQLDEEVANRED